MPCIASGLPGRSARDADIESPRNWVERSGVSTGVPPPRTPGAAPKRSTLARAFLGDADTRSCTPARGQFPHKCTASNSSSFPGTTLARYHRPPPPEERSRFKLKNNCRCRRSAIGGAYGELTSTLPNGGGRAARSAARTLHADQQPRWHGYNITSYASLSRSRRRWW